MARHKKTFRIPGLQILLLTIAVGLAIFIFGRDDPQMRETFFEMVRKLKEESPAARK